MSRPVDIDFLLSSAREGYSLVHPLIEKAPDWTETKKMMEIGNMFLSIEREIVKANEESYIPPGTTP